MRECVRVRAAIIRGGTSKGVYLLANELPQDPAVRDQVILSIFGSPDPRQVDGLGGADPLTSKVAIIAPSRREGADVDYTFGYVGIEKAAVDYAGNCGNISQGVGPFAVDEGLVPITEPVTTVRIFNTNTKKIIEAAVPVRNGKALTEGDFMVQGVPRSGARILLNFVNAGGAKTGKLLPTGRVVDTIALADGRVVRASVVDAANPAVFVQAGELGFAGTELPRAAAGHPTLLPLLEEIRVKGALLMGLARRPEEVSPAVPKVAFVAPARDYETITGTRVAGADCDLLARTKALAVLHKAYAVTGGICVSAAALIPGTVVHEVVGPRAKESGVVRVGHPSGVSEFVIAIQTTPEGGFVLSRAGVAGTARRIMDGYAYVPRRIFFPALGKGVAHTE